MPKGRVCHRQAPQELREISTIEYPVRISIPEGLMSLYWFFILEKSGIDIHLSNETVISINESRIQKNRRDCKGSENISTIGYPKGSTFPKDLMSLYKDFILERKSGGHEKTL